MFVVAILAAILDVWTSFAIETYPLMFSGWQNMCVDKSTFLSELKN